MNLKTSDHIIDLLRMYIGAAALGTALELHLFWQLNEKPLRTEEISQKLNIPFDRCHHWLELLVGLKFLEEKNATYSPSPMARTAILEAYSADTWAFLAQEARARYPAGTDLTLHISHPVSVWVAQGLTPPDWLAQIKDSRKRAKKFTRALYDFHHAFAERLAQSLDMQGVNRLMDLGGGSGVMSLALLEQYPDLTAVVIDLENVCAIGREIADKTPMADRITYHAADFLQDELPSGFDLILDCDVGIFDEESDLLIKLRKSLNEGGRLIVVTNLDGLSAWLTYPGVQPPLQRRLNTFLSALRAPQITTTTIEDVKTRLTKAGFQNAGEQILADDVVVIQAEK
jgi:predicted O-methyltransferase YrrM